MDHWLILAEADALGVIPRHGVSFYPDVLEAAERAYTNELRGIRKTTAPVPIGRVVLPRLEDDELASPAPPIPGTSAGAGAPGLMSLGAGITVRRPAGAMGTPAAAADADAGDSDDDDDDMLDSDDDDDEGMDNGSGTGSNYDRTSEPEDDDSPLETPPG